MKVARAKNGFIPLILNKLDQPASVTVNFKYQTAQEVTDSVLLV